MWFRKFVPLLSTGQLLYHQDEEGRSKRRKKDPLSSSPKKTWQLTRVTIRLTTGKRRTRAQSVGGGHHCPRQGRRECQYFVLSVPLKGQLHSPATQPWKWRGRKKKNYLHLPAGEARRRETPGRSLRSWAEGRGDATLEDCGSSSRSPCPPPPFYLATRTLPWCILVATAIDRLVLACQSCVKCVSLSLDQGGRGKEKKKMMKTKQTDFFGHCVQGQHTSGAFQDLVDQGRRRNHEVVVGGRRHDEGVSFGLWSTYSQIRSMKNQDICCIFSSPCCTPLE